MIAMICPCMHETGEMDYTVTSVRFLALKRRQYCSFTILQKCYSFNCNRLIKIKSSPYVYKDIDTQVFGGLGAKKSKILVMILIICSKLYNINAKYYCWKDHLFKYQDGLFLFYHLYYNVFSFIL